MSVQLSMFELMTSGAMSSATSSPALEDGRLRYGLQGGQTIIQCGREVAHANRSAAREGSVAARMLATYGLRSSASSASVALQQSLANRLADKLGSRGSTMFALTWKAKATPQQRQICQLAASGLTTLGSACGGLPTPSGTSNHGKNHVAGRLDEWGGSSNPFRGTELGRLHLPGFELWVMGFPAVWRELMPLATPSSRKSPKRSSEA